MTKLSGRGLFASDLRPFSKPAIDRPAFSIVLLVLLSLLLSLRSAIAQTTLTVSPSSVAFGNHVVGTRTATQAVTVKNAQTVPVQITAIAVGGGPSPSDYPIGIICPVQHPLAAGQSCTINVAYRPTVFGENDASLVLTIAGSAAQSVALTGAGVAALAMTPAALSFAGQTVGTTSPPVTVTVTNNYSSKVSLSTISATGDFAVASNSCGSSIAIKGQCNLAISFTPTASGVCSGALTITDSAPGSPRVATLSGTGNSGQTWANIQHVVIIFQENRSLDNLFQDPVLIANGADIASSGVNSSGQIVPLTPIDLGTAGSSPQLYDLDHSHKAFLAMYDGGKMDGADKIAVSCNNSTPCPPPNAQFRYVLPSDVAPYFQLAEQYVFADRMFQTNQGPSFPAHQFIISGTSAPTATSTSFVAGNVAGGTTTSAVGCIAPSNNYVQVLDPTGKASTIYPCFEHPTLTDLLDAAGVSWRYYTPTAGSIWTAPNAIQHMCGPNVPPPNATSCTAAEWTSNVMIANTGAPTVLQDIASGKLASVSWVIPSGTVSDHAGMNNGSGPSWVASIVNAIGNSSYWSNTAIIITWDDWGGWYDHVAPQVINDGVSWGSGYVYGFRVPMIVISPYAKPAYISHVTHDFGSILHFIEQVYDLPSLGYADAYADDLSDCFNFNQTPTPFHTIAAPAKGQALVKAAALTDPDAD